MAHPALTPSTAVSLADAASRGDTEAMAKLLKNDPRGPGAAQPNPPARR
ncbi:MAG: hypothetical protein Q8S33_26330 [Myxococcales bacterium]|nr:hypothetical protein [Myxococcales bacterium]